jgi:hypothetical protein
MKSLHNVSRIGTTKINYVPEEDLNGNACSVKTERLVT